MSELLSVTAGDEDMWPLVSLFNVSVSDLSRADFIKSIVGMAKQQAKHKVYNVNINALNLAYCCMKFRQLLCHADLVFNDGYGVCVASRVVAQKLYYRHTVDDWMDELLFEANSEGLRIFLLGDEEHVVAKAADKMCKKHSGLKVVGRNHGFFTKSGAENNAVVRKINDASPDILLVGMGMPIQEFWIEDNFDRLNARVYVPVGAAFRWYCGIEKRAPRWVTDNGFEWLARLSRHPVKLFRRYVIGNPIFFVRLLKTYWFGFELPDVCNKRILPNCKEKCIF